VAVWLNNLVAILVKLVVKSCAWSLNLLEVVSFGARARVLSIAELSMAQKFLKLLSLFLRKFFLLEHIFLLTSM
jgi:hypothetical protein